MTESQRVEPLLVSVEKAAVVLGIGRSATFDLIRRNELMSVKIGARRLIPLRALEDLVSRLLTERV